MKPGYVYAIQPEGMDVVKVGATSAPERRALEISRYSPAPMRFRHLLYVGTSSASHTWESHILHAVSGQLQYSEWARADNYLDDVFGLVSPAICARSDFQISDQEPRKTFPASDDFISFKLDCDLLLDLCGEKSLAHVGIKAPAQWLQKHRDNPPQDVWAQVKGKLNDLQEWL